MRWRVTAEPMKPAPPVTRMRLAGRGVGMGSRQVWRGSGRACGRIIGEGRDETREGGQPPVLFGQDSLVAGDGPVDGEERVVPGQARIAIRGIETIDLVGH